MAQTKPMSTSPPTQSQGRPRARPQAGCFVDLFEQRNFAGTMRRIAGPGTYRQIRRCARSGAGVAVESLIVGSRAYVMCFAAVDPERSAVWFDPNDRIDAWPAARAAREIDSFKIQIAPPRKNQVGYDAYARARGGTPIPSTPSANLSGVDR